MVGAGLIGSAAALTLADAGADVRILAHTRAGAASQAAAGMLAPSMELARSDMTRLATAARDLFPDFVRELGERTGIAIELNRAGILQLAADAAHAELLADTVRETGDWLRSDSVRRIEPGLVVEHGAALWPDDGAVDSTQLLAAVHSALGSHQRVVIHEATATSLTAAGNRMSVLTQEGTRFEGSHAVVAAGAWSGQLRGGRFAAAVEPIRGQLVEFQHPALTHVVYGPECYLVPRGRCTISGSTMERVGFDTRTTREGVDRLTAAALSLCPALEGAASRSWAGLRPVTPDLLPLIGPDPANPALIYACGHSRNGVLLAPLTAILLKEIIFEERLTFDITRFRPGRFADTFTVT